jgi:hypothetical protein
VTFLKSTRLNRSAIGLAGMSRPSGGRPRNAGLAKLSRSEWALSLTCDRSPWEAAANLKEIAMTTASTSRNPDRTRRHRISTVTLLVAASAITAGALGAAAPAYADDTYVAEAFSQDNGSHGWANGRGSYDEAAAAAVNTCVHPPAGVGGKQCQVVAWARNACAAFAVFSPNGTADHKWGVANGTWGATISDANVKAAAANGGGEVVIDRCSTDSNPPGWG